MGGLEGGAQPRSGASSFCPPYGHGTQPLAAPQAGREPGQCRMLSPGPGTARCPRCSWRRGPGGARRARLSAAPAAESPRARWHRCVHPQDTPGTVALGPCQLLLDRAAWCGQGRGSEGLGEEGCPQHSPTLGSFGELGWAYCSPKHCRVKGKAEETGQSLLLPGTSPCLWGDGDQGVGAAPGRVPVHAPSTSRVKRVPPPAINTTHVPRG